MDTFAPRQLWPTPPDGRITALGNQLVDIHVQLREDLAALRASLEEDGPVIPIRTVWSQCLAFCSAVTRHHSDEDGDLFDRLGAQAPELAPVLAELRHDHQQVAAILRALDALLASEASPVALRRELDGLAALLESHFTYEEKRLVAALNRL